MPAAERIATFDNDGTLWAEQPMYFQLLFALDRVKALAPLHPEWQTKEPGVILQTGSTTFFGQLAHEIAGRRVPIAFDLGISRFTWLMIRFILVMLPAVFGHRMVLIFHTAPSRT